MMSLRPMHFTRERDLNFELQFERADTIPKSVTLLESSRCRLSSNSADMEKATNPLSDIKEHFRRKMCLRLEQPLPMASRLKSVTPKHESTVKETSVFKPCALPMTQNPFSLTFCRLLKVRLLMDFP
uniref:Uncharacterized protein n=1 Tax=Opuntia streptacantha TaxID=393608 RepID=A0A7C9DC15_OPUST